MAGHGSTVSISTANKKEETGQTVLTITKALTKTTNCICKAKKSAGARKNFSGASPSTYCPTFKFVPAPLAHTLYRKHRVTRVITFDTGMFDATRVTDALVWLEQSQRPT